MENSDLEKKGAASKRDISHSQRVSESEGEVELDQEEYFEEEEDQSKQEVESVAGPEGSAKGKDDDTLAAFRHQWKEELQQRPASGDRGDNSDACSASSVSASRKGSEQKQQELEDQARAFFFQGMEAEDDGSLNEAIYYYRKALQLVPDIEFKLGNNFNKSPRERVRQESECSMEDNPEEDLSESLGKMNLEEDGLCQMGYQQRMTHISSLPVELVVCILHWVVSNDLDLRSLEMFSRVCKGFYICARDERVWKKACHKVWGVGVGSARKFGGSWRRMFVERPHLLFDGCYISKVTYVRQGEQGMDSFYRPYHLVEYYRYLRFFPDGQVLMFVSPEDPVQSLPKLKNRYSKSQGLLRGGYRLAEQKVTCILKRVQKPEIQPSAFRYRRQQRPPNNPVDDIDTFYVVECNVVPNGRRPNSQLAWVSYAIQNKNRRTGEEVLTEFDLNKRSFPALIFSRVKSYTLSSSEPLA